MTAREGYRAWRWGGSTASRSCRARCATGRPAVRPWRQREGPRKTWCGARRARCQARDPASTVAESSAAHLNAHDNAAIEDAGRNRDAGHDDLHLRLTTGFGEAERRCWPELEGAEAEPRRSGRDHRVSSLA